MSTIAENIANVRERISRAAHTVGRDPQGITLMAVSKTRPASAIRDAWAAGLAHIGENYLQEALDKIDQLQDLPLVWHFIGPIQSNKTRAIAEHFDWVQDRKSTRLNSSHVKNSYAVFCWKKKTRS